MGKKMRISGLFEKYHNLMLILYMIKFSIFAFVYRVLFLGECTREKFARKNAKTVRPRTESCPSL